MTLTERVRAALREKICFQLAGGKPTLYVYQLDPEIEEMFRNSVRQGPSGSYLSMEPSMIQQIVDAANAHFGRLPSTAQRPVILTDGDIRRFVKRLFDHKFPDIQVLSYDQLAQQITAFPLATISLAAPQLAGRS
jgi:type III secretion protein V